MNYQQTIDYLYNTLPMFSRMGSAAFKKDLDNIRALCQALGNPHEKFKTIHVGGTNGKGSVSHMLAAVLQTSGHRTGLYTSPHLYDFRERIRVDGKMAEKDFVVDFVQRARPLIEQIHPSFFEITVAMAFDYFQKHQVNIAIIEVGLGGRLDSTNIILPELSIITNIGWDHMNLLGNSLEEIAKEKAGIIKDHVPVVIGERQAGLDTIFEEKARESQSAIYFASDEWEPSGYEWKAKFLEIEILDKEENRHLKYKTDLQGFYQGKNICTVLKAEEVLLTHTGPHVNIKPGALEKGIRNVKKLTGLQGRWEVIRENPTVVLEVAHNREGIREMLHHIERISYQHLHLVIGMVKDKDISAVLDLLPVDASYYFTQASIPRALDAGSLKEEAARFSFEGEAYPEVNKALSHAITKAAKDDLIIVCGSIFLVAEVDLAGLGKL